MKHLCQVIQQQRPEQQRAKQGQQNFPLLGIKPVDDKCADGYGDNAGGNQRKTN